MDNKVYKLTNQNGLVIEFISKGAKLTAAKMPTPNGEIDVIVGYDTADEAINGDDYLGALCGRYANRIDKGQFTLEGTTYKLAQNNGTNHLHGGPTGYQVQFWDVEPLKIDGYETAFKLALDSPDGDEGYPGNIKIEMVYALNNSNELLIDMKAVTDKTTIINLTSHPYINLNGVTGGKIFNQLLEINADSYTPISDISIPTGEIQAVKGTDMDFTSPKRLGDVVSSEYPAIKALGGLDHNFVLNKEGNNMSFACRLSEPESGRSLEVYTTQPGLQIYTGMHFDDVEKGKLGIPFQQYCGVAIEAQNFPDAPNHSNFPSCVLKPGETYNEKIVYKFNL